MKIISITRDGNYYIVARKPNLIEKLFGAKEKNDIYIDTGNVFETTGYSVFYHESGKKLGNTMGKGVNMRNRLEEYKRSLLFEDLQYTKLTNKL